MSVKWSALWYIIVFLFLMYRWEAGMRRSAGVPHPWRATFRGGTREVALFGAVVVATIRTLRGSRRARHADVAATVDAVRIREEQC